MDQVNFPVIGNTVILAIVITIHVFGAFIAVGSLTLSVIAEGMWAKNKNDHYLLLSKRISAFMADFVKVNGVLGVLIVVLTIGLWGDFAKFIYQATFWIFVAEGAGFLMLMITSIVYKRTYDRFKTRTHIIWGSLASFAAIMTALQINSIWAFMMNPGQWLKTGKMIDAFLNPILLESSIHLLLPCFINTALVIFLWTFYKKRSEVEPDGYYHTINKFTGKAGAALALLQPLSGLSFFLKVKSTSPILMDPTPYNQIVNGVATPFFYTMISLAGIAVTAIIIYWIKGHEKGAVLLIVASAALYTAFFMGAYTRERARKPYLVHSVMTMDMRIINAPDPQKEGALAGLNGADIFSDKNCFACHVLDGEGGTFGPEIVFNELNDKYDLKSMKAFMVNPGGNMPAFNGTDEELEVLSDYLLTGK